jgi:uncharacterized protein (DUF4415 family)
LRNEKLTAAERDAQLKRLATRISTPATSQCFRQRIGPLPSGRGLCRPVKKPVTLRLDVDLVEWFKSQAPEGGYQTEVNRVFRRQVAVAER